jgi:hypothetical protein
MFIEMDYCLCSFGIPFVEIPLVNIIRKMKRKRGGQIEIPPKQYKKKKIEYLLHRP